MVDEDKVRTKPEILRPPVSLLVQEGEWARFSVRISGYPKPRVMWMVNGSTAMSVSLLRIFLKFEDWQTMMDILMETND